MSKLVNCTLVFNKYESKVDAIGSIELVYLLAIITLDKLHQHKKL